MTAESTCAPVIAIGRFKFSPSLPFEDTLEFFLTGISIKGGESLNPIMYNNNPDARGNNSIVVVEPPNFVPFFSSSPADGTISFSGVVYSRTANPLDMLTGSTIDVIKIWPNFSSEVSLAYTPKTAYASCKCVGASMSAGLYGDVYILAGSLSYRYGRCYEEA